ncbi:MAG: single-stranded-DNA-specific exonuclease RecJ [Ruminococcaceae bacterium]|nr:single-stranded-DNA-specific exonuclease RecJ [Oscillospiraceae bacterium]
MGVKLKKDRKKWNIKGNLVDASFSKELSSALGISDVLSTLIINRGYTSIDDARAFISKSAETLHDPFLLNDMEKGCNRILDAIKNGEKISIYGDYDVDGVTSVSILYMYLDANGANVNYYIPSRKGEGYGVSENAIRKLADDGTQLIITVDTGVTANAEVEIAKELGIDVVITDHHECRPELPQALAIINPKRVDSTYPFPSLAGVGVVFKLLCALEAMRTGDEMIDCVRRISIDYADLTAIGTIADVMPVKDENRLIVSLGLNLVDQTKNIGLGALLELCRSNETRSRTKTKKKASSGFIGFTVAPRINAAGRISDASIAVELFLSKNEEYAQELALKLCDINKDRQLEENKIAEQAYAIIEENGLASNNVIILDDEAWHHGIIGIVASRISERYSLPAILISFEGNENSNDPEAIGKGSGRSVKGMNLVDALSSCSDILDKFGGHELAAGLTVKRKYLPELRERMNEYARKCFENQAPDCALDIDCYLSPNQISLPLAGEIGILEPYGVSNPVPVFAISNMIVEDIVPIGMNRHLKLTLSKDGIAFTGMLFCVSSQDFPYEIYDEVDVAFNLEINEFLNTKSVQFNIKDIRMSERAYTEQLTLESEFIKVKNGESTLSSEEIIPQREDFALLYSFLTKEAREGKEQYSYVKLLKAIKRKYSGVTANYIKIKLMIKIFRELNIISIDEIDEYSFTFKVNYSKNKTNLEKSNILKKIKSNYSAN